MGRDGFFGTLYLLCEWTMRLTYVNALWILFSALGLVLLGVAPATVALFTVQRKWAQGEESVPVFATFWLHYKQNFVRANILGVLLAITGGVIYFDMKFFASNDGLLFNILSLALLTLTLWYVIVLLFVFPVYVHYELKLMQNVKYAFIVGMLAPLGTLGIFFCGGGALFLVLYFPKLLPIFGISLPCFVVMLFANKVFNKVEQIKKGGGKNIEISHHTN